MADISWQNITIEDFEALADSISVGNMVKESYQLASLLDDFVVEKGGMFDKRKLARLHDCLVKAKYTHLFNLPEEEILEILENDISPLISSPDYDLASKLRYRLLQILDLEERDAFKEKIRSALLRNKEKITSGSLQINNEEQEPTVGNWLKDYYSKVGIDPADSLAQNQYLSADHNAARLKPEERTKLKNLITLFERMKISSREPGGLEESFSAVSPDGDLMVIRNGVPEKVDPNIERIYRSLVKSNNQPKGDIDDVLSSETSTSSVAQPAPVSHLIELETMLKNYPPDSLEYKAVSQEILRLKKVEARQNARK